ncbi:nuclear transport factor 2 family protein [Actinophytocola gossypii]|uniref:Nuclear transport factor 2 family protein n=1 Tax=Actinophytocola gossypii TaxID=2812003 RepID=A0ABT2J4K5_9PSEU|nr:nuclear transport factor 2 family protein [Actinophytocola gossypii]MCT2582788.1 nuclear transport factor 2 family protein [Actinophytocola gossypii]
MRREQQIDTYVDSWNEPDVDQRHVLIESAWAAECTYHAPAVEARGYVAISDNITRIQRKYPNRVFCRTSDVFSHRERARYTWAMLDPAGSATIAGVDYALFDEDGKLRRVTCVYDRKPRPGEL